MSKRKAKKRAAGVAMEQFDSAAWKDIQDYAKELIEDYSDRDTMDKEMESIYLMNWDKDVPQSEEAHTKLTIAPDPTNKLIGATRLLTTTEPQFSMPHNQNDPKSIQASSWMEKAARLMWLASGRIQGAPVENDAVLSALTFGECSIGLINLKEQLDTLPADAGEGEKRLLEEAAHQTPILFETWNPRKGYALRSRLGMLSHVKRYTIKTKQLKAEWPGVDFDHIGNDESVINDWYCLVWRCVWIEGQEKPFYMRKHKLPFIPIVAQITEGSQLFEKPEHQARPFLYTLWKSGLDKRMNLALTALYTNIFAVASNAQFRHVRPQGQPEKKLQSSFHIVGGVWELEFGEKFEAMLSKGAIDPALLTALEIAQQKTTESTIYDQALGEPLGGNAAFSMVALLHQAGRLPLASPQKLTGWAIASAVELAFKWIRENEEDIDVSYKGETVTIKAQDIPEHFSFDVKLEVDLPQDKLQQANVARSIKEMKLASKRWIRENVMSVEDSDSMDEEIWSEDMADLLVVQMFQDMQQQAQQAQQAEMAAAAEAEGGEIDGGRGGLTSEQRADGLPLQAPLPTKEMEG